MNSNIYKTKFVKILIAFVFGVLISQVAYSGENNNLQLLSNDSLIELQSERVKIQGCISLFGHLKSIVITDRTNLDDVIRKGASIKLAQQVFKDFDLEKQSLIGINLVSGWCKEPVNLSYKALEDKENKKYILQISYDKPDKPCCPLIAHPVWLKVPNIPEDYKLEFCFD